MEEERGGRRGERIGREEGVGGRSGGWEKGGSELMGRIGGVEVRGGVEEDLREGRRSREDFAAFNWFSSVYINKQMAI